MYLLSFCRYWKIDNNQGYLQITRKKFKIAKTATTGLAAAAVDAVTIHRFAGVGAGSLTGVQYGHRVLASEADTFRIR